jgi:hypothetical protein
MGWHPTFINRLARPGVLTPIFILEVFKLANGDGVGSPIRISSAPFPGCFVWLDPSEIRLGGARVTPVSWTYQAAALRVKIDARAPSRISLASSLRRGALCKLRMGFPGDDIVAFETIFLGSIRGIESRAPGAWDVEIWDLTTSLQGRVTTSTQKVQLFQVASTEGVGTLTATYNVGDTSIEVDDLTGFVRENGGSGLVRIQCPVDGHDFLLTYTGTATGPTRLTGVSSAGVLGTTAHNCPSGHAASATHVPYINGPLYTVWSKIALSTGSAGTNGPRDTLPETWGFALPREIVDVTGGEAFGSAITAPASGTADVYLYTTEEVTDSASWLSAIFSAYGLWLCVRQGELTLRGAQSVADWSAVRARSSVVITDADIVVGEGGEGLLVEMYDNDRNTEYAATEITGPTGSLITFEPSVGTFPAARRIAYDLSRIAWSNESAIQQEVANRLHPWAVSLGEALVCRLSGLHWMQLVPGDVVRVDIRRASGRHRSSLVGWANRPALVVEVAPDLYQCQVMVRLATLPIDRNDDWG